MLKKTIKAFSLIELLVVITILGILFSIGIPAYNQYVVKSKVLHIFALLDVHKVKIMEKILNPDHDSADDHYSVTDPVKFVNNLEYVINRANKQYTIKATANMANLGAKILNGVPLIIELTANIEDANDLIVWNCSCNKEYIDLVPKNCRENN